MSKPRKEDLDKELLAAAIAGKADAVDELADKGANFDMKDSVERSAFWHTAAAGDTKTMIILMKHGANPNTPDREDITPLNAAVTGKKWQAAELLLEQADINARAGDKQLTALHSALWSDLRDEKTARVKFLMEHWADAKVKDASGKSPYDHAQDLAAKFPFAQQLLDFIEEYKDGPVARQQYLDRKRDDGIRAALQGTESDIVAPAPARWKKKLAI